MVRPRALLPVRAIRVPPAAAVLPLLLGGPQAAAPAAANIGAACVVARVPEAGRARLLPAPAAA